MKTFSKIAKPLLLALPLMASQAPAAELDIEITNLTHGIFFTPLLVTAHNNSVDFFTTGSAASAELQAMAEGGNITPLVEANLEPNAIHSANPAGGLLAASASVNVNMNTGDLDYLSIVSMLLPTNDGFVGLDSWSIPEEAGTYTVYLLSLIHISEPPRPY